ncbi:nuclear pore complex protein Nup98-Nup96-like [Hermetia illucens]|uniref:nuclear pore complex protein Nup98-Nup96-like n=1 Tax=Hermetia illucens TaxID=343691 RepID=UPI0018CC40AE|nr:nuclear pore complex protein Nup98-Nup96-like [Hermetia illucens]
MDDSIRKSDKQKPAFGAGTPIDSNISTYVSRASKVALPPKERNNAFTPKSTPNTGGWSPSTQTAFNVPLNAPGSGGGTSIAKYLVTYRNEILSQRDARAVLVNCICITHMLEYCNKSLEELRWEDYLRDPVKSRHNKRSTESFGVSCSQILVTNQITNTNSGTLNTKYHEVFDTDVSMLYGRLMDVDTKLHCITGMWEYKGKSLEELRYEDYLVNRKGAIRNVFDFSFEYPYPIASRFFKNPFTSGIPAVEFPTSNFDTSEPRIQQIETKAASSTSPTSNLFENANLPNGQTIFDFNSLAAIKAFPSLLTKTETSDTRRPRNKSLTPIKLRTPSTHEKHSTRRHSESPATLKQNSPEKTAPFYFKPPELLFVSPESETKNKPQEEPNLEGTLSKLVSLKISPENYEKMEHKTFTNNTFRDVDMNSQKSRKFAISKTRLKPRNTNKVSSEGGGKPQTTGIVLKQEKCYTIPSLDDLAYYLTEDGRCVVPEFVVEHSDYGSVSFPGPIDVAGLNLDEIVVFRYKEVIVYPDDKKKPPLGFGLNRRAKVTINKIWPHDKTTHEPITDTQRLVELNYVGKLHSLCDKHGTRFIDYQPETGSWTFEVEHF